MRTIVLLALTVGIAASPVSAAPIKGAQMKAAMVYNFARFAAWPPNRFSGPSAPVVLCVTPAHPLAEALAQLEGQPVGARRLDVRLTASAGPGCHMAVVDSGASAAQIERLQQQGVMTISDGWSTGVVALITVGRQTRFQIDTRAARQAGVSLSSQLLRLAVAVK